MMNDGMSNAELPDGWEKIPLLSVSRLLRGVTYSRGDVRSESFAGSIPVLRANNLQDRFFQLNDLVHVPKSLVSEQQHVVKGDVVVATSSGSISVVGKAVQARENMNVGFGAFCGLLRPDPSLHAPYFGFFFSSDDYRKAVSSMARGVNINNLKRDHFESLELPLAPLAEQRRIADKLEAVLGRVDACRARLDRVPALLKRFRQSVLSAATSGGLTAEWRMTNGVNDEWEETQIQHVANVGTGSTPLRSNSAFFAPKGTPWVTSAATSKKFVTESEEFVTDAAIKAHRLKKYPVGTLLVAMYGEGKTRGQVTELGIEATINQACAAIVVDESIITKRFVKFSLEANYLEMRELAEGGNQPNLNLSKIKEFLIGLPALPEQQEIVRRVEDLFTFADRIEARLATAQKTVERLTPATLAKAFRGELVPQDPNDEPASALLERLKSAELENSPKKTRQKRATKA